MPLRSAAIRNLLLAACPDHVLDWLLPHLQRVPFEKGQELVTPGVPVTHVYFRKAALLQH
jgi:hypothetical protein